ncbi:MAG: LPXTG cell wall anchor domain-containing protein [Sphingobium sp.]
MWSWIKVPKGIALLAFLLPWVTISCEGQPLAKASGVGLAFGQVTTMGQAAGQTGDSNFWLILAILVIVAGLAIVFIRDRTSAKLSLGASIVAILLILAGTARYSRSSLVDAASARQGGSGGLDASLGQSILAMIDVQWHFGYYLALLALLVATGMAALVLTNRDAEASEKLAGLAQDARKAVEQASATGRSAFEQHGGTCPTCGRKVSEGVKFCPEDGSAIETPPSGG